MAPPTKRRRTVDGGVTRRRKQDRIRKAKARADAKQQLTLPPGSLDSFGPSAPIFVAPAFPCRKYAAKLTKIMSRRREELRSGE